MRVAIVGTGYVGLSTGAWLAQLGHEVCCGDVDVERVEALARGEVPFVEEGLELLVAEGLQSGRLAFVLGAKAAVHEAEVIMMCLVDAPVTITDPASAELVKYAANAFLATKLSFVNSVANLCESVGADIGDVVRGMGFDHRIGADYLQPGPGWGGSCSAMAIIRRLAAEGAVVRAYDPTVSAPLEGMVVCADAYGACQGASVVVVLTEWEEFAGLDLGKVGATMVSRAMVDARNLFEPSTVRAAGFSYDGIGRL